MYILIKLGVKILQSLNFYFLNLTLEITAQCTNQNKTSQINKIVFTIHYALPIWYGESRGKSLF